MVTAEALIDLPLIISQENEAQPQFQALLHDSAGYCLPPTIDGMAEETFDHRYNDGVLQYPDYQSMSMQRFLIQEGPYVATHPMLEQQYPQFSAKDQSPVTPGLYGAPNPWPQSINTGHDLCPPERWSSDWASPNESCSGTTGAPWSPPATDSCSDYDPRYSNWAPPHPYPGGYAYADYGSGVVQGPTDLSCQSNGTGALSEIQQYPDTEPEDVSLKGDTPFTDRGYSGMSSHLPVRNAHFHRDEGLGSSVNESAMDSPEAVDDDEDMAMDSVNADSGEGSEYAPRSRSTRTTRNRNPRRKGAYSPLAKRSSISKADPHQLTRPAKIAKRTSSSSISRPSFPTNQSTSSNASQTHRNSNGKDHQCPHCLTSFSFPATLAKHVLSTHTRPFICSFSRYGCTSRFGSKNEWKRHVSSQHLCPEIWRCDLGACVPRPSPRSRQNGNNNNNNNPHTQRENAAGHNEFNRKDLFMSHLRRMHKPHNSASRAEKSRFDSSLESIGQRCCIPLRATPPKTICGYCAAHPHPSSSDPLHQEKRKDVVFDGAGTWDERMEHVGRHLEKEENLGYEVEDEGLRDWMVGEGLLKRDRELESGWRVVGTGGGRRRKVDVRRGDVVGGGEEDAEGDVEGDADADADGEDDV